MRFTRSQIEALEKELNNGGDVENPKSDRETRLHKAAWDGDSLRVELLLRFGANVHALDYSGRHPIHMAIPFSWQGYKEGAAVSVIEALLEAGADLNARTRGGDTPLSLAYSRNHPFCVRALVRAGADPSISGSDGTPIVPPFVVDLLRNPDGASVVAKILATGIDINAEDKDDHTLLGRAAFCGSPSAVTALLRAGADAAAVANCPPLCSAAALIEQAGGAESVWALVEAGADLHAAPTQWDGRTPLCHAVCHNSQAAARLLLQLGASLNTVLVSGGYATIHVATWYLDDDDCREMVNILLQGGADINLQDDKGDTALHWTLRRGLVSTVQLLLASGADPNICNRDGLAALPFALLQDDHDPSIEIVSALLQAGADVNAKDHRDGQTPLHRAFRYCSPSIARLLLESRADPDIHDSGGKTALHYALGSDYAPAMVSALLQAGADVNAKDNDGRTPLHSASLDCSPSIARLLLESGADPHIRDIHGMTPLKYAIKSKDTVVTVPALLKAGADIDAEDVEAVSSFLQKQATFNVADDSGATLLHYTSRRSSPSVTRLLLKLGADPHIRDNNGRTPLFDVIFQGENEHYISEVVAALLEGGAEIDAIDAHGLTPLLHAISAYSLSRTLLLLNMGANLSSGVSSISVPLRFLIEMVRQTGIDVVLALVLRFGIDSNDSGHKINRYDLSDSEKQGCKVLMRGLRKKMLARPSSARGVLIRPLSQLYHVLRCYPIDAELDECEVVLSQNHATNFGGFADCWQGLFLGCYKVAMKTPRGRFAEEVRTRRLEREAKVWSRLNHPNVLPFLGLCVLDSMSFLVSPWMENGHALEFVQRNPDADCLQLLAQVAKGLEYLHTFESPVIHGDLRGPNILISELGNAYIADFGLSELDIEDYDPKYSTPWLTAGHPRWQAPETLKASTKKEARRTLATDIFAFGRVMLELFTKEFPFSYIAMDIMVAVMAMEGKLPERPHEDGIEDRGLNDGMWELMLDCWAVDPSQRPDAKSVIVRLNTALKTRSERVSSPRPTKRLRMQEELSE